MKAAVVKGKRHIVCEEVPTPSVQPGTLLIKTKYCSICGTDLEYVDDQLSGNPLKPGAILGHEFAAEVAAIGEGVEGWSVGDRVTTGDYLLPCGQCYYCRRQLTYLCQGKDVPPRTLPMVVREYANRPGSMAEYFVRPPHAVQRIPDNVSDEEAALVEPLRTGVSAIRTTGIKPGESVVVIGAGKIGLYWISAHSHDYYVGLVRGNFLGSSLYILIDSNPGSIFSLADKPLRVSFHIIFNFQSSG